mgnify:CR=1 FL=1
MNMELFSPSSSRADNSRDSPDWTSNVKLGREAILELLSTHKPASEGAMEVEVMGAGGTALQTSTTSQTIGTTGWTTGATAYIPTAMSMATTSYGERGLWLVLVGCLLFHAWCLVPGRY